MAKQETEKLGEERKEETRRVSETLRKHVHGFSMSRSSRNRRMQRRSLSNNIISIAQGILVQTLCLSNVMRD